MSLLFDFMIFYHRSKPLFLLKGIGKCTKVYRMTLFIYRFRYVNAYTGWLLRKFFRKVPNKTVVLQLLLFRNNYGGGLEIREKFCGEILEFLMVWRKHWYNFLLFRDATNSSQYIFQISILNHSNSKRRSVEHVSALSCAPLLNTRLYK